MSEFVVIAAITPKEGKVDRVQELLSSMASATYKNEPKTLRYHLHRQTNASGTLLLILLETYADKAAFHAHLGSEDFKALVAVAEKEDLLAKTLDIWECDAVAGFASR